MGEGGLAAALPTLIFALAAEAAKVEPLHAVEPMLGEQRVVEQIVFSGHLAALEGTRNEFIPLFRLGVAAAEPHQGNKLDPLAGGQPLNFLDHLLAT